MEFVVPLNTTLIKLNHKISKIGIILTFHNSSSVALTVIIILSRPSSRSYPSVIRSVSVRSIHYQGYKEF